MKDPDQDRVVFGFFCIVVFGRSVTFALQNLRTFDAETFKEWYEPWKQEMLADPLLRFFNKLRSDMLKGIAPMIGVVLAAQGVNAPPVGSVEVHGVDVPTTHRGQNLDAADTYALCELYIAYLEKVVESAVEVIFAVEDRWLKDNWPPPTNGL